MRDVSASMQSLLAMQGSGERQRATGQVRAGARCLSGLRWGGGAGRGLCPWPSHAITDLLASCSPLVTPMVTGCSLLTALWSPCHCHTLRCPAASSNWLHYVRTEPSHQWPVACPGLGISRGSSVLSVTSRRELTQHCHWHNNQYRGWTSTWPQNRF